MRLYLRRKIFFEAFHPQQHSRGRKFFHWIYKGVVPDFFLLSLFSLLIFGAILYWRQVFGPLEKEVEISFSLKDLGKYTFFSMSRGLLAYCISLVFSVIWGVWSAKERLAEKTLIPILDILQSIPILGFMPGIILLLVGIFSKSNVGLELACILLLFTSQAWNMAFGVYHALRTVPLDKIECARIYHFSATQCLRFVELPFATVSLLWNSIMSVAGGWFFLMLSEAFQLGSQDFRLPGLGSYMSVAAAKGDFWAMFASLGAMFFLILFLDQCFWRPLVIWSQKFYVEEVKSREIQTCWFLQVLRGSRSIACIRRFVKICSEKRQNQKKVRQKYFPRKCLFRCISLFCLGTLLLLVAYGLILLVQLVRFVTLDEWFHLMKLASLTFLRVVACLVLGLVVMFPLGLLVGLSDRLSKLLQPVIQIGASFPATLLFPLIIFVLSFMGISIGIGTVILMLMGTQWYILFNVLAGAKAIPSELKEVARVFNFTRKQRLQWLYIPAIFPYLITGLIAAAGGAWNASIVAEYVSYKGQVLVAPGLGSTISLCAQQGNIPLLVASILVMSAVVVLLNYQVWLRLYHYSEERFALNY